MTMMRTHILLRLGAPLKANGGISSMRFRSSRLQQVDDDHHHFNYDYGDHFNYDYGDEDEAEDDTNFAQY